LDVDEAELAGTDSELNRKIEKLVNELDEFMNDDFNTAKVLANLFDLVPTINSLKDKHIAISSLSKETFALLKKQFNLYLTEILGLELSRSTDNGLLDGVVDLLIQIRKEARAKKDFATSDKIRNELLSLGVQLKDEKDGNVSWSVA
jgi:cysteinyl-tRNA synthetase